MAPSLLLPVFRTRARARLASEVTSVPRMRAWTFSKVKSPGYVSNMPRPWDIVCSKAFMTGSMGMTTLFTPRCFTSSAASSTDPLLEYGEGMSTAVTLSFPRASTPTERTRAESMPPESPTMPRVRPHLLTKSRVPSTRAPNTPSSHEAKSGATGALPPAVSRTTTSSSKAFPLAYRAPVGSKAVLWPA